MGVGDQQTHTKTRANPPSPPFPSGTRVVLVQRSCGYNPARHTLTLADIGRAVESVARAAAAKHISPRPLVCVDNCYGEFTETAEPGSVGADLIAGSFIKGIGGSVAPCGGYVAGTHAAVAAATARLTAPGCGADMGAVDGHTLRLLLQGLWLAPHTVGEAVKGGRVVARALATLGCATFPSPTATPPFPFVTAAVLGSEARLVAFCGAIQAASPVGAYVRPDTGPRSRGWRLGRVWGRHVHRRLHRRTVCRRPVGARPTLCTARAAPTGASGWRRWRARSRR